MKEEFILRAGGETITPIKLMNILATSLQWNIIFASFVVVACSALM